jgi:hypothetical protein
MALSVRSVSGFRLVRSSLLDRYVRCSNLPEAVIPANPEDLTAGGLSALLSESDPTGKGRE